MHSNYLFPSFYFKYCTEPATLFYKRSGICQLLAAVDLEADLAKLRAMNYVLIEKLYNFCILFHQHLAGLEFYLHQFEIFD